MKILFINASLHRHGHVAKLAKALIGDHSTKVINLIDEDVKQIGQQGS